MRRFSNVDAGIVDEDIDAAEIAGDALGHGGDCGLVGDVGGHGDRPSATSRQFGDRGGRFRLVAADDCDGSACLRKAAGHAEPDAAIAAGDDRDLAVEIEQS